MLFKYSQESIDRYATARAHERFEQRERERAAAPADKSSLAPKPAAPAIVGPGNSTVDPWLQALEARERSVNPAAAAKPARQPGTIPKDPLSPAVYNAVTFLSEALSDGKPHRSSVLLAHAQKQNITEPTLRRARLAIGATTEKVGKEWLWQLPSE